MGLTFPSFHSLGYIYSYATDINAVILLESIWFVIMSTFKHEISYARTEKIKHIYLNIAYVIKSAN